MIGSMLYVTPSTPDIMQAVGMILIFHSSPKETNVHAVKRIFIYLKGNLDFGLWYPAHCFFGKLYVNTKMINHRSKGYNHCGL